MGTRGDTKPDQGQNSAPEPPQDGKRAIRSIRKVTQPEQGQVPRGFHPTQTRRSHANHTRSTLRRTKLTTVRFNRFHALSLLTAVLITQMWLVGASQSQVGKITNAQRPMDVIGVFHPTNHTTLWFNKRGTTKGGQTEHKQMLKSGPTTCTYGKLTLVRKSGRWHLQLGNGKSYSQPVPAVGSTIPRSYAWVDDSTGRHPDSSTYQGPQV